jgi:hypothetical protein
MMACQERIHAMVIANNGSAPYGSGHSGGSPMMHSPAPLQQHIQVSYPYMVGGGSYGHEVHGSATPSST